MGWGSSTRRGGGQKVRYVPQNQGNQTFLAGYPGICRDIPEVPEKFEKKKFVFNFRSLKVGFAKLTFKVNFLQNLGFGLPTAVWAAKALGTSPPLTEVSQALRARNAEKISNMSPAASGPGTPKSLKKVSGMSPESLRKVSGECFWSVPGLFGDFLGSWGRRPRETFFRDSFGISGPEGPRDLCKGRAGSQL